MKMLNKGGKCEFHGRIEKLNDVKWKMENGRYIFIIFPLVGLQFKPLFRLRKAVILVTMPNKRQRIKSCVRSRKKTEEHKGSLGAQS